MNPLLKAATLMPHPNAVHDLVECSKSCGGGKSLHPHRHAPDCPVNKLWIEYSVIAERIVNRPMTDSELDGGLASKKAKRKREAD